MNRFSRIFSRFRSIPPAAERPWAECRNVNDQMVQAFFSKNDDINQSVPLALAEQVKDEVLTNMTRATAASPSDLARMQGMLMGLSRFTSLYMRGIAAANNNLKRAGR